MYDYADDSVYLVLAETIRSMLNKPLRPTGVGRPRAVSQLAP